MSAFEDFVQTELPLRPYTTTNPPLESIPVRRGAGPRQLQFVTLNDGEVLGKVGGTIQGVSMGSPFRSHLHTQVTQATTWTVTHNKNSTNVMVQIVDTNKIVIIPDTVEATDVNTVVVTFTANQDGAAYLVFLD